MAAVCVLAAMSVAIGACGGGGSAGGTDRAAPAGVASLDPCVGVPDRTAIAQATGLDGLGEPASAADRCTFASTDDPGRVAIAFAHQGPAGWEVLRAAGLEPVRDLPGAIADDDEVAVLVDDDVFSVQVVVAGQGGQATRADVIALLHAWGKA